MTPTEILDIENPTVLFTGTSDEIHAKYRTLCKIWHPDINPGNTLAIDVFKHIGDLYKKAINMLNINGGITLEENTIFLKRTDNNKTVKIKYILKTEFELGLMYISKTIITYIIDSNHEVLFDNAIKTLKYIQNINNPDLKEQFKLSITEYLDSFKTIDNKLVLICKKEKDEIFLPQVLNYFNNKIDPKHVAWIMSRLYNMVCYLDHNKICNNGLLTNSFVINPKLHTCRVIGGWWYSVRINQKMIGCPIEVYNLLSDITKENKLGNIKTDLDSIRLIGRELLGDKYGSTLRISKIAPEPMLTSLMMPSTKSPIEEFKQWDITLTNSFGKRKYINMEITL